MCFISAWKSNGPLPRGLISHLLLEGQVRGLDGAGIAWRTQNQSTNYALKRAVKPSRFVNQHQSAIREARSSHVGLIHTRRASLRMPLNTEGAQPIQFGKMIYIHNGFVSNWQLERSRALVAAELDEDRTLTRKIDSEWITDSYVLGPRLDDGEIDLTDIAGSMALAWMVKDNVYVTHLAKELEGFHLAWNDDRSGRTASATFVASTVKIFESAINRLKVDVEVEHVELKPAVLYTLMHDQIVELDKVPHSPDLLKTDRASSAPVRTLVK